MFQKFFDLIWRVMFPILLVILILSSSKVIYLNLKHFNEIKEGILIEIAVARRTSEGETSQIKYMNQILLNTSKDTISGVTANEYKVGDQVRLRYRGQSGAIVFEVNDKRVSSKYDLWDVLSPPILFLLCSTLLFGLIKSFISKN